MMSTVKVKAEIDYLVQIGSSWSEALVETITKHDKILVLCPEFIDRKFGITERFAQTLGVSVFITPEGELAKDIGVVSDIWEHCASIELGRMDAIIGFGGGATTDLAGFVAATWLRGVQWYALPSTLAGMVDAAIGGKTGINTSAGKNLVGAFHSPQAVYIDPMLLDTLSDRDFAAGLAEVIKTGFIADRGILENLSHAPTIQGARSIATTLITQSVTVKATVVSQDFTESALREILNFGHTLGHAIEKHSRYSLRHGEAVAIGLVYAAELSVQLLALPQSALDLLRQLLTSYSLPTTIDPIEYPWSTMRALMAGDKKSRSGILRFVGISSIGKPEWLIGPDEAQLIAAYERISQ